jgi:hypothetical protein
MGPSEFDLFGCYERASLLLSHNSSSSRHSNINNGTTDLNFWDVYWYRSHHSKDEGIDLILRHGMETQMRHHQEVYSSMTRFNLDIFGMHSSTKKTDRIISENEIAIQIKEHVRVSINSSSSSSSNTNSNVSSVGVDGPLRPTWHDERYNKPLTCRGRVDWDMEYDTWNEYYHSPKTCMIDQTMSLIIPLLKKKENEL